MKGIQIVLLCEDNQTDAFIRRFLKRRNFRNRDIETRPLPHGSQSAEQWVREQYPTQLQAVRAKHGAMLLVVIDADNLTTDQRCKQLENQCEKEGVPRRKQEDPVVVMVPRRNIETWFAYLDGENVEEQERYPRLERERDCERHARELYRMCHEKQELREPAPDSLREACVEYGRLKR